MDEKDTEIRDMLKKASEELGVGAVLISVKETVPPPALPGEEGKHASSENASETDEETESTQSTDGEEEKPVVVVETRKERDVAEEGVERLPAPKLDSNGFQAVAKRMQTTQPIGEYLGNFQFLVDQGHGQDIIKHFADLIVVVGVNAHKMNMAEHMARLSELICNDSFTFRGAISYGPLYVSVDPERGVLLEYAEDGDLYADMDPGMHCCAVNLDDFMQSRRVSHLTIVGSRNASFGFPHGNVILPSFHETIPDHVTKLSIVNAILTPAFFKGVCGSRLKTLTVENCLVIGSCEIHKCGSLESLTLRIRALKRDFGVIVRAPKRLHGGSSGLSHVCISSSYRMLHESNSALRVDIDVVQNVQFRGYADKAVDVYNVSMHSRSLPEFLQRKDFAKVRNFTLATDFVEVQPSKYLFNDLDMNMTQRRPAELYEATLADMNTRSNYVYNTTIYEEKYAADILFGNTIRSAFCRKLSQWETQVLTLGECAAVSLSIGGYNATLYVPQKAPMKTIETTRNAGVHRPHWFPVIEALTAFSGVSVLLIELSRHYLHLSGTQWQPPKNGNVAIMPGMFREQRREFVLSEERTDEQQEYTILPNFPPHVIRGKSIVIKAKHLDVQLNRVSFSTLDMTSSTAAPSLPPYLIVSLASSLVHCPLAAKRATSRKHLQELIQKHCTQKNNRVLIWPKDAHDDCGVFSWFT